MGGKNNEDLGVDYFATVNDRFEKRRKRAEWIIREGQWGNWRFDTNNKLLIISKKFDDEISKDVYEVAIEECNSSAQILDWIVQVSQKKWTSREDIGCLVEALDELLSLQGYFCGSGKEMSDGSSDYASKKIDSLIQYVERKK